MESHQVLMQLAVALLGGITTTLVGVLAWIGARLHHRIDAMSDMIDSRLEKVNNTLRAIEVDIRDEIQVLDRRVGQIEAVCQMQHNVNLHHKP